MTIRQEPKIGRQRKPNGKIFLFISERISPPGAPRKYRRIYFGEEGKPETAAAIEAYRTGSAPPPPPPKVVDSPSIARLCREFMSYARQDYPETSKEPEHFFAVLRPFVEAFGEQTTESFSLTQLEEYRARMILSGRLCRREINARIRRILRVFQFGARRRLVPLAVNQEVHLIESIRRGRLGTKDNPRVKSVPLEDVLRTIPFLPGPVAAMVKLQLLTGARPGEIRVIRAEDLDTSGPVWRYTLETDKTARFRDEDDKRVISFGAEAQEVIRPFLRPSGYLFTPAETMAEKRARDRARRKTKVQPSQQRRHVERLLNPRETLNECYSRDAYRRSISRAASRAGVPGWFPYQLRHTVATAIQRAYGLEIARQILGHSAVTTTEIYIDKRRDEADKLAEFQPFRGVFSTGNGL